MCWSSGCMLPFHSHMWYFSFGHSAFSSSCVMALVKYMYIYIVLLIHFPFQIMPVIGTPVGLRGSFPGNGNSSTPTEYVSPATRRSIGLTSPAAALLMSPTAVPDNDDAAEKRERQRSRLVQLQRETQCSPASPVSDRCVFQLYMASKSYWFC